VFALAGVLIFFLWPQEEAPPPAPQVIIQPPTTSGGRGTVATPENIEQLIQEVSEPPRAGHYITSMNMLWRFDSWNSPSSNAYVSNDVRNEHKVYFDLTLNSDGRLIYSSPFIPQGSTLTGFALDEQVSAGEHAATVTYHLVDDDDENISQVSVRVTLNILR